MNGCSFTAGSTQDTLVTNDMKKDSSNQQKQPSSTSQHDFSNKKYSTNQKKNIPTYEEYSTWKDWKAAIRQQFKDQEPYFFPSDRFLENFINRNHPNFLEFIYDKPSEKKFSYTLFRNDTPFRMISEKEHRQIPHPHTIHDHFFSFSKKTGKNIEINRMLDKAFPSFNRVHFDKQFVQNMDGQVGLFNKDLLVFKDEHFQGYWYSILDHPSYTDQEQITFLKNQQEKLASKFKNIDRTILAVYPTKMGLSINFFILIDKEIYHVHEMAPVIKSDQFNDWSLEIEQIDSE